MSTQENEMRETLVSLLNDYGNGIHADYASKTGAWLDSLVSKAQAFDVAQEQASYALRYRHGEDLRALSAACRNIANLVP